MAKVIEGQLFRLFDLDWADLMARRDAAYSAYWESSTREMESKSLRMIEDVESELLAK